MVSVSIIGVGARGGEAYGKYIKKSSRINNNIRKS